MRAHPLPRLIAVGTANPPRRYTQQELIDLFGVTDARTIGFFRNSHIRARHLVLPEPDETGRIAPEDGTQLLDKHRTNAIEVGGQAIQRCLAERGLRPEDVDSLVTVTSTGFLCPSLSAWLVDAVGFRPNVARTDIVGMGCNAAQNGLRVAAQAAAAHPGRYALLLACEICSAAYVFDFSLRTTVVNSLFGDGAAAALLVADPQSTADDGPAIVDAESFIVPAERQEMRFDFIDGKFNFYLGRDIPYLVGEAVVTPMRALLERHGLRRRDIAHWLVHSGGKKVIDSVKYQLGLTEHDLRHTRRVLRDYGNLSSASILFSYAGLVRDDVARAGDWGVSIAMGPGLSIETALLQW